MILDANYVALVGEYSLPTRGQLHKADTGCYHYCKHHRTTSVSTPAGLVFLVLIAISPEGRILVLSRSVVFFSFSCSHLTSSYQNTYYLRYYFLTLRFPYYRFYFFVSFFF